MALDKTKKSNRLLQSKRYTIEQSTDAQEAFTRTLDINAGDVYIRKIESGASEPSGLLLRCFELYYEKLNNKESDE